MTSKVFRLSLLRRWITSIVVLVAIGLLIQIPRLVTGFNPFEQGSFWGIWIVPVIVILFLLLLFVYIIWMIWSYSIEFSETELRVGKYGNPIARRTIILYSNIKHVRRGTYRGWIEIVLLNGKSFILMAIVAEGIDGLIAELEKHIPAEKFQPFLRKEMKRYSKSDLARWGFPVFIWLFLLLQWSPRMILPYIAWETVLGEGFLPSGYINNYWVDDNGTAWASFMRSFDTPQVIRVDSSGSESWIFDNREDVLYADAIVAGDHGQPWLLHDDFCLRWNGTSWQKIQSKGYSLRGTPPIVIKNVFWSIASRENESIQHLLGLNFENGEEALFPLPYQLSSSS